VEVTSASRTSPAGVANGGYWGIPVKPQTSYRASFYAKVAPGFAGPLTVSIQSNDGKTLYAQQTVQRLSADWKQYQLVLKTGSVTPTTQARLVIATDRPAKFWLGLVSLFPPTWKNRTNGLRPDLMQMMVDMKPKFLRFPGGNYLEGNTIAERFDWKKTIGPLAQRSGHQAPWGYRSTDGMGLMEFLLWAEDIGAQPLLGVYAGYSLRGDYIKPGPDLVPYIQDALDEIEYITGPVASKWGALRARDGHPKPFPLTYVEIGNEDFFDKSGSYDGRYAQFHDAIKARYPHLKIVSSVGFEQPREKRVHSRQPDVVDEHYYRSTDEFLRMEPNHYERYERKAPEIFVGEWAAFEDIVPWDPRSRGLPPTPSMKAAIGDAAFMAAMERNSDLVTMQCYAPLFVNVNPGGRQWRPNLIGYDALRAYGSPSYYAIRMFSTNLGDTILKPTLSGARLPVSVTQEKKSGTIFIKLVNPHAVPQSLRIHLNGVRSVASSGTATILAADPTAINSMDEPTKVVPVTRKITGVGPSFMQTLEPNSITVLQLKAVALPAAASIKTVASLSPNTEQKVTSNTPPVVAPQSQTQPAPDATIVTPLKAAFKDKLLIGAVLSDAALRGNSPDKVAMATTHFNALTAENAMKPDAMQPREGQFNFAVADQLVELAEKNGAAAVGHTLIWHSQTPRWFFEGPDGQPASRELTLARMRKHISTVVGRYKGRIKQWDVVNEA
ncbi:MAG TPA: endo-1,4-beta-xylanase, partial [Abditibacteriaceae bacterium]